MIWDINFADGTTIRAKHEKGHCACIIAQCQRIQSGETTTKQLLTVSAKRVQVPETAELPLENSPDTSVEPPEFIIVTNKGES